MISRFIQTFRWLPKRNLFLHFGRPRFALRCSKKSKREHAIDHMYVSYMYVYVYRKYLKSLDNSQGWQFPEMELKFCWASWKRNLVSAFWDYACHSWRGRVRSVGKGGGGQLQAASVLRSCPCSCFICACYKINFPQINERRIFCRVTLWLASCYSAASSGSWSPALPPRWNRWGSNFLKRILPRAKVAFTSRCSKDKNIF